MDKNSVHELIEGARSYETLHVPALFGQWSPRVLDAAQTQPGERLLDVACGTGVLAREAVSRVGPDGYVAGIDPALGMLKLAEQLDPTVDWRQGVAETLPFPDQSFDICASQFGLMFFTDRECALREMLRVLVPGGRLAIAVWDALENSAAYSLEVDLLQRIAGQEAADALRAPFVLGDVSKLRDIFTNAGVASVEIDTQIGTARFPTIRTMVEADLRGWLPIMGVQLDPQQIDDILLQAESVLQKYVDENGQVIFKSPAHIVTGIRK